MKDQIKSFLNEEQDPKAVEKITLKLNDLLMRNEEIGYIGVQKKPAITVFPDSIVMTNKRIIMCRPKNLGLSMDFTDYTWDDVAAAFVKENILGSEFSFTTKTDLTISIDYIPKAQARKLYTFAKEQLDELKTPAAANTAEAPSMTQPVVEEPLVEEPEIMETEEVTNYAELMPLEPVQTFEPMPASNNSQSAAQERSLAEMTSEELFAKLQNYKKLLDNGLILQGEYDALKKEILGYM